MSTTKVKARGGRGHAVDMAAAKRAISSACLAVSARTPSAIYQTLMLGNGMVIGSDGETRLEIACPEMDFPVVCLPADRLRQILAVARGDTLAIIVEETTTTISCGGSLWKIPTVDAAEYPAWQDEKLRPVGRLPSDQLRRAVTATAYATDTDSSRFALGAVCIDVANGTMSVVGTDGRRISAVDIELDQAVDDSQTLVPSRSLVLMARLLGEDGAVQVEASGSQVVFTADEDGFTLRARVVAGRYPRWRDVFPAREAKSCSVDRMELARATRAAAIVTSEESRGVRFSFSDDIALTARSAVAGESSVLCPLVSAGTPATVSLDPAFVLEFIGGLGAGCPDIEIEATGPGDPVVLRCDDVRGVIMPLAEDA